MNLLISKLDFNSFYSDQVKHELESNKTTL